jgi:hypothetical protein
MSHQPNHRWFGSGQPASPGPEGAGPSSQSGFASPAALAVLWLCLVAVAVAGRTWQPAAHVTPLAGVSLVAGAVFPSMLLAASVPVAALAIGNLFLPGYGSLTMAVVVYAALVWPVILGQTGLLGQPGRRTRWMAVVGGALASSLGFFFSTNTAHWLLTEQYPHTPAGLLACLAAGLPFHRWMPVGDIAWSLALFGCLTAAAAAGNLILGPRRLAVAQVSQGRGGSAA